MVMTGLIQSPAGELLPSGHERAVCEVGNPKLQSWTAPSLHPANPRPPKKCPADPLRVFMSQLCLGATARSHFHSRTPLSGRPPRCPPLVRPCARLPGWLAACMHLMLLCYVWRVHICHLRKGIKGQRVDERGGREKKREGYCMSEREAGKTQSSKRAAKSKREKKRAGRNGFLCS